MVAFFYGFAVDGMGRADRSRSELEALQSELAELEGVIAQAAQAVSTIARARAIPALDDPLPGSAGTLADGWSSTGPRIAAKLSALSTRIDAAMAPLEDEPQRTLKERVWIALVSLFSLRWTRPAKVPADELSTVLADLDVLQSLLITYRERLVAVRHSVEADLIDLSGHRAMLADRLAEHGAAQGEPITGTAVEVETRLQSIQDLTIELNRQVNDANLLLNKLAIEAERAILLKDVLSPDNPELLVRQEWPVLPHLAPLMGLREKDMLSSVEIDRRKQKIDARFSERFAMNRSPAERAGHGRPLEPEVHHA